MFKDLIKAHVVPLLRQHGFKKKDLTWNRPKDGIVQVVDFQLSRFSSEGEDDFTINLGVFDSQVWKQCWAKEPPKFIKEEDCFPRIRIGYLLNGFSKESTDHWWACGAEINESELGNEIVGLIERKCLPFLEDMSDRRSVIEFYSAGSDDLMPVEKIYLAIIKNSIGDADSSNKLLNEVGAVSNAWAKRVDQVRSQLD